MSQQKLQIVCGKMDIALVEVALGCLEQRFGGKLGGRRPVKRFSQRRRDTREKKNQQRDNHERSDCFPNQPLT